MSMPAQVRPSKDAPEAKMSDEPMSVIRSYAWHFWNKMTKQGFSVELEELVGEFGVVYAQALNRFVAVATTPTATAQFGTYIYKAFDNRVKTIKTYEAKKWQHPKVSFDEHRHSDDSTVHDEFDPLDEPDYVGTLLSDFDLSGEAEVNDSVNVAIGLMDERTAIVFREMCRPSDPVINRFRQLSGNAMNNNSNAMNRAIAEVYDLTPRSVYYLKEKIRSMFVFDH